MATTTPKGQAQVQACQGENRLRATRAPAPLRVHEAHPRLRLPLRGAAPHRPRLQVVQRGGQRGDDDPGRPGARRGRRAVHASTATWGRSSPSISIRRAPSPAWDSASRTVAAPTPSRSSAASPASCSARGTASRRGRALVPLRLSRARARHPPSRHDQPSGSDDPVAAGCAFAFQQDGNDRIAVSFIGEGGRRPATSTRR